jgi:hypothetical protein
MKKKLCFILIIVTVFISFESCNECVGVPISSLLFGKWKLEKITTSKTTINPFLKNYFITFEPIEGTLSKKYYTKEILTEDNKLISTNEWISSSENCKDKSIIVTYKNNITRTYKLTNTKNEPFKMEASEYLTEIDSDTVRYYYSKQ